MGLSRNSSSASTAPNISAPSGSCTAHWKASIRSRWSRQSFLRLTSPTNGSGPVDGMLAPCATARCGTSTTTASARPVSREHLAHGRNRRFSPQACRALPLHSGPARRVRLDPGRAGDPLRAVAGRRTVPDGGVLLPQRLHNLRSVVALRRAIKFRGYYRKSRVPGDTLQHLHLHLRITNPRPYPWQIRRAVAAAAVPRAQDRQGARDIALGGANRAGHGCLAVDV